MTILFATLKYVALSLFIGGLAPLGAYEARVIQNHDHGGHVHSEKQSADNPEFAGDVHFLSSDGAFRVGARVLREASHSPDSRSPAQELDPETTTTNKWCPVLTDELVDPDIHTEYRGERVYLCCQKCLKQFRADPSAFGGNIPALALQSSSQNFGEDEQEGGRHVHAPDPAENHVSADLAADTSSGQHDHAGHGDEELSGLSGLVRWLGRFHPMIVHFPIALLLMATVAEMFLIFTGTGRFAFAVRFCLWGGALGAIVAAPLGWANALSVEGDYIGFTAKLLLFHRWTGVATAIIATVALIACERSFRANGESWKRRYRVALFLSAILVGVAGHLGAALIYGWEYLDW